MDEQRRRILSGLGGAALYLAVQDLFAQGRTPKGVARVRGDASVNGVPAKRGMVVRPGDTVITGRDGEIVFVIGKDGRILWRNLRFGALNEGAYTELAAEVAKAQ